MLKKSGIWLLILCLVISVFTISVFANENADVPDEGVSYPDATVSVKAPLVLTPEEHGYMIWPSGDNTVARPLQIVMNFKANESFEEVQASYYAKWKCDFYLSFEGLEGGSIIADNCYLAGEYGSYGWIVIPTDGLELEEGIEYPVVSAYDANLTYENVCDYVKNFTAAIYVAPEILEANPDFKVTLALKMTNPADDTDVITVGEPATYTAATLGLSNDVPEVENSGLASVENATAIDAAREELIKLGVSESEAEAAAPVVNVTIAALPDANGKIVYNVAPTLSAGNVSVKISEFASDITFRLPLLSGETKTHANVYHGDELLGTYKVVTDENGSKYVEVKSKSFSEYTVEPVDIIRIGDVGYSTLEDAIKAANAMTGDVVIEISAKVEYTDSTPSLVGAYDSISFVGTTAEAEIYIARNGTNGYISGEGNDVAVSFNDLILSKAAGGFAYDAGFMNVAFSVYGVASVSYTNCVFANGSCTSTCPTTYDGCTFYRSHDKYGLWVYSAADCTVTDSSFNDYRGIKMYAEGGASAAGELVVESTDFSALDNKPAIVLTYGNSVTLDNNTYSATGTFELDLDGAPNGAEIIADAEEIAKITCVNDNGACGVIVDGKIYTTVAQAAEAATEGSEVTLLHSTEETVELPKGTVLNTNGYTAENVSVKVSLPEGDKPYGHVSVDNNGFVKIYGETRGNAKESYALRLYSGDVLVATTTLQNIGGIIDGDVTVTWNFFYTEGYDPYWVTVWEEGKLNTLYQPDRVVLVIDGVEVNEGPVYMSRPDGLDPVKWRKMNGVEIADLEGEGTLESPYLITSLAELEWFRDDVNAGNTYAKKYVKLTESIDLEYNNWTPIGNSTNKFCGHFDGGNNTIYNLKIETQTSYVGFFGYTSQGSLKNLVIENADIDARLGVGALVGCPFTSDIDNITLTGLVTIDAKFYVGGVAGRNAYGDLTNITVDVLAESYVYADSVEDGESYRTYVGGVVGFLGEGNHVIENVTSNIKVIGTVSDIGGITGIAHYGNNFNTVAFEGTVEAPADAENVGGVAGVWHNQAGQTVTFENCTSTGTVTVGDETATGSIVGSAYHPENETPENSGSLVVDGAEQWLKVAKIGDTGYASFSDAVDAANAITSGTVEIVLLANTEYDGGDIDTNVVLDLNGYTLTSTGSYFFWLDPGTLTVKDSSEAKTGTLNGVTASNAILVYGNASLTVESGTILAANNVIFTGSTGNTVVINGGKLESLSEADAVLYLAGSDSTVTVNGGTLIGKIPFNYGTLTVFDGIFSADVNAYCAPGYGAVKGDDGMYGIVSVDASNGVARIGDKYFLTLSGALIAASETDTIYVLCDVTEELAPLRGTILPENGTVTITATNSSDWYYLPYNATIGAGVTFNALNTNFFCHYGTTTIEGTVTTQGLYLRYADTKLVINAPGSFTLTSEMFIIRDTEGDAEAGIYVNGDNNSATVELKAPVVYFYQGIISAKDADITVGTYWQTQGTDAAEFANATTANLVLDNSNLNVTVSDHDIKATGASTVTLKNGSALVGAKGLELSDNAVLSVDESSSISVASSVASVNGVPYNTLSAAINAAKDGDTVVLTANVSTEDGIVITDKNIVIDLAGYTYTVSVGASTNNRNFKINGSSVVTIKNGTMIAAGDYSSGAYGTVRTEGTASVTLTDLKLYNYRGNGLNIKAADSSTVYISDTEIYSEYGGGIESCGGTVTVDNVTVVQKGLYTSPWNSMAISVNGGGTVIVNSGSFSTECLTAEEANNQGSSHGPWVVGVLSSGGTLIINGGTFTNDNFGDNSLATYARGAILVDAYATVEINGGTFNALGKIIHISNNIGTEESNPTVTVLGGLFSADPTATDYNYLITVPEPYAVAEMENGMFEIVLDLDMSTVYINSAWASFEYGEKIEDGKFFGMNAFATITDLAVSDETVKVVIYAGTYSNTPNSLSESLFVGNVKTVEAVGGTVTVDKGNLVFKATAPGEYTITGSFCTTGVEGYDPWPTWAVSGITRFAGAEGVVFKLTDAHFVSSAAIQFIGGAAVIDAASTIKLDETKWTQMAVYADVTCYGEITLVLNNHNGSLLNIGHNSYASNVSKLTLIGESAKLTTSMPESTEAQYDVKVDDNASFELSDGAEFVCGGYIVLETENGNSASLVLDTESSFTAGVLAGDGEIAIDAANFNGTPKTLLDLSGTSLEGKNVTVTNLPDDFGIAYGEDGDIIIVTLIVENATTGEKYQTLADAFANAQAGDVIVLLGDVTEDVTAPSGIVFNGNGFTVNGTFVNEGDITFIGNTVVNTLRIGSLNSTITIGEGASVQVTSNNRITVSYGNVFNITGTVSDAKTADKASITPSLVIPGGVSFTGDGSGVQFNVTNAYVVLGSSTTKDTAATGSFYVNFENSIAEFTKNLVASTPRAGYEYLTPELTLSAKDSVITMASHMELWAVGTALILDNTDLTVGGSFANAGNVELFGGAYMCVKTPFMSSHGGNTGTISIEAASFELVDNNEDWVNAGEIIISKNGKLISNDFNCGETGSIKIDVSGFDFDTEIVAVDGNGVFDFTSVTTLIGAKNTTVSYADGDVVIVRNSAASVGGDKFETLEEAILAAGEGDTVVVNIDIALDAPITVAADKKITIDLAGHTVSFESSTAGDAMITNKGDLTITDTSAEETGKITYTYTGAADTSYGKGNYTIYNHGTLTVLGGTVENGTAAMSHASYAISMSAGSHLTLEDGKILNLNGHAIRFSAFGTAAASITVNGGYVEGTRAIQIQLPSSDASQTPEFSFTMNGGELKSNESTYNLAIYVYSYGMSAENLSLSIAGGDVNGNIALDAASTETMAAGAVSVTGGNLNGAYGVYSYADDAVALDKITISGGVFASNYCEFYAFDDGFIFEANENGTYGPVVGSYAAELDGVYYKDLQAALNAAGAGETVALMSNVTVSGFVGLMNGVELDLNGYTVTASGVAVFGTGSISDSGETKGLVIVPKGNLALAHASYPMLPVWNAEGTGYVFVSVKDQYNYIADETTPNGFIVDFKPSIKGGGVENVDIFGDGATDNELTVKVIVKCFNDGVMDHDVEYYISDELLARVYTNGTSIRFTVTGATDMYEEYVVEVVIESASGIKYSSDIVTHTPNAQ